MQKESRLARIGRVILAIVGLVGETTRQRGMTTGRLGDGDYGPESDRDFGHRITHRDRYR
jgi:hypothetical protein